MSELELAYRTTSRPMIAITGTNGKTTATALCGAILRAGGVEAQVCGNIGHPVLTALETQSAGPLVIEASSFQLHFTAQFRPKVAVLLNITPDHLDWHEDIAAYRAAKLKAFINQEQDDWSIVSSSVADLINGFRGRRLVFGSEADLFAAHGQIIDRFSQTPGTVVDIADMNLVGDHNVANAMAAAAVGLVFGIARDKIRQALSDFIPLEHRLEPVATQSGVDFYNDSKATNPQAAIAAIRSFPRPIILIAGGRNKGSDFQELADAVIGHVKLVLVIGEAADDLQKAFSKSGIKVEKAVSLAAAVQLARHASKEGDVVLMSPACASYDMFADYEERGRFFKSYVRGGVGAGEPVKK